MSVLESLFVLIFCSVAHQIMVSGDILRRPVIGILAQKSDRELNKHGDAYIYADYVKLIEQAGGLVVPVKTHQSELYYKELFSKLNGVVFPGGGVSIISSPYAQTAKYFYNMSIEANDRDDYFPILGICLGFEELTVRKTIMNRMVRCDGEDLALPLRFSHDAHDSRLFENLPDVLFNALKNWNVTYNNHQFCMTTEVFYKTRELFHFYKVISTNVDRHGVEFVSTMEAYRYPFYGTQWHPEKNIYLWSDSNVNHSALAVQVTQFIADFFVNEARKSTHEYPEEELTKSIIFNYQSRFMGSPSFHNIYFFTIHCWYGGSWWQMMMAHNSGTLDLDGMLAAAMMIFLIILLLFVLTRARVKRKDVVNDEPDSMPDLVSHG